MQYKAINYANDHHKEISRIYYTNNYTYTVILFIATILSAIMPIIITNKGLQSAEPLAKIFFFSFFSISIFLDIMMSTMGQKENLKSNVKQYLFYEKVQNNILPFKNTSEK